MKYALIFMNSKSLAVHTEERKFDTISVAETALSSLLATSPSTYKDFDIVMIYNGEDCYCSKVGHLKSRQVAVWVD